MPSSLIFKDAEAARDAICAKDQKEIRQLYLNWADEVGKRAEYYHSKETASSYWQEQQMLELQRQLTEQSKVIANQIYTGTKESMYTVVDSVVGCNAKYLSELGFPSEGLNVAFTSVPTQVVNNLVTGQIYEGGWNLSSAIWSDNEQTLHDIYQIVAQGRAMNMSAYEVSEMLEQYVNPNKAKQWNLTMSDGRRIYKRSVDYNAQRLTRTLTQHAYQQGVIQCAKDNPFIQMIIWRANGSRTCELCLDRDGKEYRWDEVPMDHPNGMCTMEPKVDMDKTIDQLANWFNGEDGEYPEIDAFASKVSGYVPQAKVKQDVKQATGTPVEITKAEFTRWQQSLPFDERMKILNEAGIKDMYGKGYKEALGRYYVEHNYPAGSTIKGMELCGQKLTPRQKALQYAQTEMQKFQNAVQGVGSKALGGNVPEYTEWIKQMQANQTSEGLKAGEKAVFKAWSGSEKQAVKTYTGAEEFVRMNGYMREAAKNGFTDVEGALKASKANDKTLRAVNNLYNGLSKSALPEDMVLCRGSDAGELAGLFMDGNFAANKKALEKMTAEELNQQFAGAVGRYSGFTSTGGTYGSGFQAGGGTNIEFYIYAPKGTQAASVSSLATYGGVDEVIVNAGTTVKCRHIEEVVMENGNTRKQVYLEIIGQ